MICSSDFKSDPTNIGVFKVNLLWGKINTRDFGEYTYINKILISMAGLFIPTNTVAKPRENVSLNLSACSNATRGTDKFCRIV